MTDPAFRCELEREHWTFTCGLIRACSNSEGAVDENALPCNDADDGETIDVELGGEVGSVRTRSAVVLGRDHRHRFVLQQAVPSRWT